MRRRNDYSDIAQQICEILCCRGKYIVVPAFSGPTIVRMVCHQNNL